MILLSIIFLIGDLQITTRIYRFEECYVELWYQIPVRNIISLQVANPNEREFSYKLLLTAVGEKDTTVRKGIKHFVSDSGDYVYDYFPLWLYPDTFSYQLFISALLEKATITGGFKVFSDTLLFYASDLVLGLKKIKGESFSRRGIKFLPLILPQFSNYDTLFSYIEIYGLVPDSLFYTVHYQIKDSLNQIVYECNLRRPKLEYTQFDTISIPLYSLNAADYTLSVNIYDPALNTTVTRECNFRVKEVLPDILCEKFAWEIKYLVSKEEYERFSKMDYNQQVKYLKKFWAKRNYKEFERRLLQADEIFSVSHLKGRDTPQGKFYILKGPPDEIKKYGIEKEVLGDLLRPGTDVGRSQELWIYEREGIQVLFRDTDSDGVYELVGVTKIGTQEFQENLKDREELWKHLYKCD